MTSKPKIIMATIYNSGGGEAQLIISATRPDDKEGYSPLVFTYSTVSGTWTLQTGGLNLANLKAAIRLMRHLPDYRTFSTLSAWESVTQYAKVDSVCWNAIHTMANIETPGNVAWFRADMLENFGRLFPALYSGIEEG